MKFRVLYTAQDGSKSFHYSDDKRFMLGLDGVLYEDYGTPSRPLWEVPFDVAEPPIVQQYTGCHDKNKKPIYEGDKVSYDGRVGTVEFFAGMFHLCWDDQTDNVLGFMMIDKMEIV